MSEIVLEQRTNPGAIGANLVAVFIDVTGTPSYVGNDGVPHQMTAVVAGGNGEVQYYSNGSLAACSALTFNATSNTLAATNANISGNLTVGGRDVGIKDFGINSQSANYTLALLDRGNVVLHPTSDATPRVFTIPTNANVPFGNGAATTFINQTGAGNITLAPFNANVALQLLQGSGGTGNRTLTANGSATIVQVTPDVWCVTGTNLT